VQYFSENGTTQSWLLLTVYGIRSLWATIGILFDISIIYITWKNK
jgi:hypothetical protein